MVNARFYSYDKNLLVEMKGHAEYASKGPDIVCAGVSSLAYTLVVNAENAGFGYEFKDNPGDFMLGIRLQNDKEKNDFIKNVFDGIFLGLANMAESYPENISVEYLEEDKRRQKE